LRAAVPGTQRFSGDVGDGKACSGVGGIDAEAAFQDVEALLNDLDTAGVGDGEDVAFDVELGAGVVEAVRARWRCGVGAVIGLD
jgi:hypothetical protein